MREPNLGPAPWPRRQNAALNRPLFASPAFDSGSDFVEGAHGVAVSPEHEGGSDALRTQDLESNAANGDPWDLAGELVWVINCRLDDDYAEISQAFPTIRRLAARVVDARDRRRSSQPPELCYKYRQILERMDGSRMPEP